MILSFIADPNWPGAREAIKTITKHKDEFMPTLIEGLTDAKNVNDSEWADYIEDLIYGKNDGGDKH